MFKLMHQMRVRIMTAPAGLSFGYSAQGRAGGKA
jgi:hypothetical protein